MFHLSKQVIRPNKKSPIKDSIYHTNEGKKRPDINQIKEQIESILKRNNSPLFLKTGTQSQKSQKYLNLQTLQRKKSKIFTKAPDQYIQMAKNNRKLYEQFLLGGDIVIKKQKSITAIKQNLQTITMKSTSYDKDPCLDFVTSKANFNSYRTISHSQRGKKSKSMFHNQEHHLGLGKILFSTDNEIKFRKTNLLTGKHKSQSKSIFKDTANQTFFNGSNFELTKYVKSQRRTNFQVQSKELEMQSTKQKSFEVTKKQILIKQPLISEEPLPKNNNSPRILEKTKAIESMKEKNVIRSLKGSLNNPKQNQQPMNKTLNVIDDQLLVYYGKLKNRKFPNKYDIQANKQPIIHKIRPKDQKLHSKQFTKFLDISTKKSRQFKKKHQIQSSWKTHRLDPWQKIKMDEDTPQDSLFEKLQDQIYSQELSFKKF